ncbi:zinc-alpha-2-glycoprotein-like [Gorilla gorilla gorilla]|uniref:zinc-alpha-2-glycoprotein-like n=1 Tax=Gorilla gorilla gorilla TaxID=9595 RepID=UPI00300A9F8D
MVRMVPVLLSLLHLLGPAVPQETQDHEVFSFAGHYSLTYLYTGLSRPGKGTHRLQGTVFLNGRAFFHYNSEDRKAEPLGPWRHVEGVEDWEKQSQLQKAREDIFMETLKDIVEYYNDSNGQ